MSDLRTYYTNRIENLKEIQHKLRRQIGITSLFRLFAFILAIAVAAIVYRYGWIWTVISFVVFMSLFLFLVGKYSELISSKKYHAELIKINEEEVMRLDWNFTSFDKGEEFIEPDHPYTGDLDIYGDGSLFQYLNATCTSAGRKKLAGLLLAPPQADVIGLNQAAISELKEKIEWRQSVQARGRLIPEDGSELHDLKKWLETPVSIIFKPFMMAVIYGLPAITIVTIILSAFLIRYNIPVFLVLIQLGIIASYLAKINKEYAIVSRKNLILNKYRILLEKTENEHFTAQKLTDLQTLLLNPIPVSSKLKKLTRLTGQFDWRLNMLMGIVLNAVLMWDLQCIRRLNNWKTEHGSQVSGWFDILAEFDALNSLGGYAYNNPAYATPGLSSSEKLLSGQEIGHPLIPMEERVDNDLEIDGWGQLTLVTGSNMAGKSTFLRTIGINLILAMTGAPVCATRFEFQPVEIYTSMRIGDSLRNRESTFYAELRRLKSIIDHYKKGSRALIFLDEILKGTNSKDKHYGSKMLIRQLIEYNAAGIIATHDLDLSKLEDEFPNNLQNYSFEVQIEGGQFTFDYKLKQGVCKTLNATELMKQMGISVGRGS